jgi:hypothetical protein
MVNFITFLGPYLADTPRRRRFHLVFDKHRAHQYPNVKDWITAHPPYRLYFTPVRAAAQHGPMVCRDYPQTDSTRTLRRVLELTRAIQNCIRESNDGARSFIWSAK